MRKPRYPYSKEHGGKVEQGRYHPTNESRDAYGNFKRQYRSKVDGELSLPVRSRIPRYEPPHSEYREQTPKENKAESQTRELEPQTRKQTDEMNELKSKIDKLMEETIELRRSTQSQIERVKETMGEISVDPETDKALRNLGDAQQNLQNIETSAEKHEPPDNYEIQVTSKDDRHEAESKSTKDTPQDSSSPENAENYYDSGKLADMTVTYPGELSPEEAEALVKEIEESGIVDDEKAAPSENSPESLGNAELGEDKLNLTIDQVAQPSEILDQLAKELDMISSNEVEGNPSDNEVLPELLDRVMTAEKVVKDTADSLEVIEPAETLEPLRQEEDAEI